MQKFYLCHERELQYNLIKIPKQYKEESLKQCSNTFLREWI